MINTYRVLKSFEPIFVHRGTPTNPVPSWGREGWFFTPKCGLKLIDSEGYSCQLKPLQDEDTYQVELPVYPGYYPVSRIKSTHLIRGWRIVDYSQTESRLTLYLPGLQPDFEGGIFSTAYTTYQAKKPDHPLAEVYPHPVVFAVDICPAHKGWASIFHRDSDRPVKLVPDYLWDLRLTDQNGTKYETAFVDPGFDGTLYVPDFHYHPDAEYTLEADPYLYLGTERYRGQYRGENRVA